MPIIQQSTTNLNSLQVPDLYVQIQTPATLINGVPTDILGIVGTATWGPVGVATIIGNMAQYQAAFGAVQNRKYDMGTQVNTANQQGAQNFRCARVTDTTDVAAMAILNGTATANCGFYATSLYTGSAANGDVLTLNTGSKAGSYKLTIYRPGALAEVFDNITGSGATFWANVVSAVNNGNAPTRGASQYVTLTNGAGTNNAVNPSSLTLPVSITLGSGTGSVVGTDGVTSITASVLVGTDTLPRRGMYALRNQGCGVALLADADDSTQWTTQSAFGLAEGIYMILTAPAGIAISNGSTGVVDLKVAAGLDSYACKLMHGDWIYWNDQTNNVLRLVSPQGFAAGRLVNLSPEQSGLNKQLAGVVGSQKSGVVGSGQLGVYTSADLGALFQNSIDVISNPQPGGNYWGLRGGFNASSNAGVKGDEYTRLTDYIAKTLLAGMGIYIGQTISSSLFNDIRATLLSFLNNMLGQKMLAYTASGGLPFSVVCDASNNPLSRTGLGYVQVDAQVQYMGINRYFVINLQGGATVQITSSTN